MNTKDNLEMVRDAREVNPNLEVMTISTLNGDGLDTWFDWLKERVQLKKAQT